MHEQVRLPLTEVITMLCDLNEFVVSLDRLGSRRAHEVADDTEVAHFVDQWNVTRRLAWARGVLGEALDAQLSAEANEAITARCEQGHFYGDHP